MNVNMKSIQKSLDGSWNGFLGLGLVTSGLELFLLLVYYYDKFPLSLNLAENVEWYWYVGILGLGLGIIIAVISTNFVKSRAQEARKKMIEMAKDEELMLELEEEDLILTKHDVSMAALLFVISIIIINYLLVFTPLNMIVRREDLTLAEMGLQLTTFYLINFLVTIMSTIVLSRMILPNFEENVSQES